LLKFQPDPGQEEQMRFKEFCIASMIFLALALAVPNVFISAQTSSAAYDWNLLIVPDAKLANAFFAKLVVKEIGSNKVLVAPSLRFRAGEPVEATSGENENGIAFQFSVAVSPDGSTAHYKGTLTHANNVISSTQASISLRK
jgi:hypothetical protein